MRISSASALLSGIDAPSLFRVAETARRRSRRRRSGTSGRRRCRNRTYRLVAEHPLAAVMSANECLTSPSRGGANSGLMPRSETREIAETGRAPSWGLHSRCCRCSPRPRRPGRTERGVHHIGRVREVAGLKAVAEHDRVARSRARRMNRGTTPLYCELGSCLGPNTLK